MLKINKLFFALIISVIFSCNSEKSIYSNSVVSSPHPYASEAGKLIFSVGGNAFDAAVASAFTLAVVEPSMSGIGGRLQAIYMTSDGYISGVDAMTQIPESYKKSEGEENDSYGYKTIGIPGVVAGLLKLQKDHGKLDLETVMKPAIYVAENGFQILPGEIKRIEGEVEDFNDFEATKKYFLNSNGEPFKPGDKLIQKDLANTLKQISKNGNAGFYEGEIAQKIVQDIQANGGYITLKDLKNYKAIESDIISGDFNGYKIHSLNLPSFGAITIQIMQIIDQLEIEFEEDRALKIAHAIEKAYEYRIYQNQPDSLKSILSKDRAKQIADKINNQSFEISSNDKRPDYSNSNTAHLTVADEFGNVVSITQTIGPIMGSKVVTDGLGFLYNVTMGPYLGGYLGEDKPGDRVSSHVSPTLFTQNGKLILAIGAAGGNKIPPAITQVAYRFLKQKLDIGASISLPRVYKFNGPVQLESHLGVNRFYNNLYEDLYDVEKIPEKGKFGRVNAIAYDPKKNKWIGASDPDWEGSVSNYEQ